MSLGISFSFILPFLWSLFPLARSLNYEIPLAVLMCLIVICNTSNLVSSLLRQFRNPLRLGLISSLLFLTVIPGQSNFEFYTLLNMLSAYVAVMFLFFTPPDKRISVFIGSVIVCSLFISVLAIYQFFLDPLLFGAYLFSSSSQYEWSQGAPETYQSFFRASSLFLTPQILSSNLSILFPVLLGFISLKIVNRHVCYVVLIILTFAGFLTASKIFIFSSLVSFICILSIPLMHFIAQRRTFLLIFPGKAFISWLFVGSFAFAALVLLNTYEFDISRMSVSRLFSFSQILAEEHSGRFSIWGSILDHSSLFVGGNLDYHQSPESSIFFLFGSYGLIGLSLFLIGLFTMILVNCVSLEPPIRTIYVAYSLVYFFILLFTPSQLSYSLVLPLYFVSNPSLLRQLAGLASKRFKIL